jgi:hypothetical protein
MNEMVEEISNLGNKTLKNIHVDNCRRIIVKIHEKV